MQAENKRPEDTAFKQQRLKAWQPILTPSWVIASFLALGVIFVPIGIVVLKASASVVEVSARYDQLPACAPSGGGKICNVTLTIPDDMQPPIYFYYQLSNFYQNHRRYVKSRSDAQLRGDLTADTSSCDPLRSSIGGRTIYPCGLIANSFFNDNFTALVCSSSSSSVSSCDLLSGDNWQKKGIAWDTDVQKKFLKPSSPIPADYYTFNTHQQSLPDVTDEDFIVWMRTAGLPTFKKLHRKILTRSLRKGDVVNVQVSSTYDVSSFNGQKWVVLSTTSWLGGKNDFLGWAYIIVGIICFLLALAFAIKQYCSPRKLGDMTYFHHPHSSKDDKLATR